MDRLHTMSVFAAVAEAGGFAPAARRLKMSPPSVTRAVAELEARLGCRLLHRTTRSLRLTEAGQRYLADCRRILTEIEEADRLLDLLDRYPDLSVSSLFVDRVVHLIDEGIDVAIRIAELPDSSLTAVRVGAVRRVLCASPDYLAVRGRPRAPADLAGHEIVNFVTMTPGGEWTFEKGGKSHSFRPPSRLRLNTADAAIAAALAGRGITRVLSYMIAPQVKQGSLEILLEDYAPPAVPVHVVHKEPGQTSARVRAVVDHLVQHLRRTPALASPTARAD
jgi:DNA-binding transcriptional LysR family regulator